MSGHPDDFLTLVKGTPPSHSPHESEVRLYSDTAGALRTLQSDGTDAAVGGGTTPSLDGVLAYLADNTPVDVGNGTIPWDTVLFDTGDYLDTNTGKFIIPADKLGIWRVETILRGAVGGLTNLQLQAFFDGPLTDLFALGLLGDSDGHFAASGVVLLNIPSADVWDMTLHSTDTGSASVDGGLNGSRVALTYLGTLPT